MEKCGGFKEIQGGTNILKYMTKSAQSRNVLVTKYLENTFCVSSSCVSVSS